MGLLGQYVITIVYGAITWLSLAIIFTLAQKLPKQAFVPVHLLGVALVTALSAWLYFKFNHYFSPFHTMVLFMLTIFAIEAVVFGFLYPEGRIYLNFWDYILPVFIGASTIYLVGQFS